MIKVLDAFDVVGVMEDLGSFVDDVLGRRNVSLISTHRQGYSDEGRPYPLTAAMYQTVVDNNQCTTFACTGGTPPSQCRWRWNAGRP